MEDDLVEEEGGREGNPDPAEIVHHIDVLSDGDEVRGVSTAASLSKRVHGGVLSERVHCEGESFGHSEVDASLVLKTCGWQRLPAVTGKGLANMYSEWDTALASKGQKWEERWTVCFQIGAEVSTRACGR